MAQEDGKGFSVEPVSSDEAINANDLYLDEVTVTPADQTVINFALLEVPLPPGASVEPSTWGINLSNLDGNKELQSFSHADYEEGDLSYQVPIPTLKESTRFRQLIRFTERGEFNLPPVRFFRMYQPQAKALSDEGNNSHWLVK